MACGCDRCCGCDCCRGCCRGLGHGYGGGWGYGGGYMEGYKNNETPGIPISNRRAGGGEVTNIEGGVLINLTSWLGVTASYNWVDMNFGGEGDGDDADTELHLMEAGVRLTF